MAADSDAAAAAQQPNDTPTDNRSVADEPATPQDTAILALNSPQVTLPSTEVPGSPIDPNQSFKTENNDDRMSSAVVVPSSLTPPPSSQMVAHAGNGALHTAYGASQRSALFSPPATGLNTTIRRDGGLGGADYVLPTSQQVADATSDELRTMVQTCIAEHAKLKMEAAHHKLQNRLLSIQADEDAKRAAVEHEMNRREIEALRTVEHSRQAVRELSAASESAQIKYLQMKVWYEEAMDVNDTLSRRVKMAKKVISQKEEEVVSLTEERDMLLNRIRENREHFHMLCSPGGIFHGAMTPKTQSQQYSVSTPQQAPRATPKQTPRSANRDARVDRDHGPEPMEALLQALSQDNNSAPTTPTTAIRPVPRMPPKHTRNTQSLSSLPTTPLSRPQRYEHAGLLPSVNLVPQSEPRHRYTSAQIVPGTPPPAAAMQEAAHKSRESTISAEDNEELARQAVAKASLASSRGSRHPLPNGGEDRENVYESQASQEASEMLRRDARESFEVASSLASRDGTPAATEKSARLQAKLFSGITKNHTMPEKRKFNGSASNAQEALSNIVSQSKRIRMNGSVEENPKVGLGIQYGYS